MPLIFLNFHILQPPFLKIVCFRFWSFFKRVVCNQRIQSCLPRLQKEILHQQLSKAVENAGEVPYSLVAHFWSRTNIVSYGLKMIRSMHTLRAFTMALHSSDTNHVPASAVGSAVSATLPCRDAKSGTCESTHSNFVSAISLAPQHAQQTRSRADSLQDAAESGGKNMHATGGACTSDGNLSECPQGYEDLPDDLQKMVATVQNFIIKSSDVNVSADTIAGLSFAKKTINEILIFPRTMPHLFKSAITRPPRGLLLFGPPGTGKTLLAKWIATECHATFFNISASSIFSKYIGEGEKLINVLFLVASRSEPSVIFIDEIDSVLSCRKDSDHESSRRMKNEFLTALDGAGTGDGKVLLIGATNMPWDIDAAALRRFPKKFALQ